MWLPRPRDCPICGAPFTTCTTFHQTDSTGAVAIAMPRNLRAQLVHAKAAAVREPETVVSAPFTTATYDRTKHHPRQLRRRKTVE